MYLLVDIVVVGLLVGVRTVLKTKTGDVHIYDDH